MGVLQQTMGRIGNSVITRLLVIAGMVLTLLIPVEMIKGSIHGREQRRGGISELSSSGAAGRLIQCCNKKRDKEPEVQIRQLTILNPENALGRLGTETL